MTDLRIGDYYWLWHNGAQRKVSVWAFGEDTALVLGSGELHGVWVRRSDLAPAW